jgi:hypothetical protein
VCYLSDEQVRELIRHEQRAHGWPADEEATMNFLHRLWRSEAVARVNQMSALKAVR